MKSLAYRIGSNVQATSTTPTTGPEITLPDFFEDADGIRLLDADGQKVVDA